MQANEYKGYCLFSDVEDEALRTRNRAVVMSNIAEFNTKNKKISAKGSSLIIGYAENIPPTERGNVVEEFKKHMQERGFMQ